MDSALEYTLQRYLDLCIPRKGPIVNELAGLQREVGNSVQPLKKTTQVPPIPTAQ
jgi:hypothetical protein